MAMRWHLVIRGQTPRGNLAYSGLTVRARSRERAALVGMLVAQRRWAWTHIEKITAVPARAAGER